MYQVPQHISKDKIFIVNKSDIDGRLDPKMALYNQSVQHALFPMVRLKNLLLSKPQYGANEAGIIRDNNEQPRYIRITDIDENGLISPDELGATVANLDDKYILNENDIVIARSGATVGKAYIHKLLPYTCVYAGYLIRFIVDSKKILPDYLFAYTQLNTYKEWVNAIQRPSAQPNINAEEYQSLEIPLPNISKQQEIVGYIDTAYAQKRVKEAEAQQLLDSIDGYLLKELGITIPSVDDGLKNRIFLSSFSKIEGDRLDPKKYSTKVCNLYTVIQKSDYEIKKLNQFVIDMCSGDWGMEDSDNYNQDIYVRCLTLRGTEIDNQYNILINKDKAKTRLIKKDVYENLSVGVGDIIVEKSGGSDNQPVGRVAFIDAELLASYNIAFSNFLFKFKVKDIDPMYLYFYLKTMYNIGVTDSMQSQTNGIKNLIVKEFLLQTVVNPPHAKQQEIVKYITLILQKAKERQAEGKAILENAKRKVEQMIIG